VVLKEHEKFWAFLALGFGVLSIAMVSVIWPPDSEGTQRILDAAMGALSLALGAATNALFRISEKGEREVTINQPADNPVPTTESNPVIQKDEQLTEGELPKDQRL
jgi:hypothetical protein